MIRLECAKNAKNVLKTLNPIKRTNLSTNRLIIVNNDNNGTKKKKIITNIHIFKALELSVEERARSTAKSRRGRSWTSWIEEPLEPGGASRTPISGVVSSLLCVLMLCNAMSIHLLAVGMYEGASTMAAFKQKAVVHPNMVVNTLVVARGITASGAKA